MTENVIITELPRRRRPAGLKTFFVAVGAVGVGASLIDSMIGQPICLGIVTLGFVALRFWPAR